MIFGILQKILVVVTRAVKKQLPLILLVFLLGACSLSSTPQALSQSQDTAQYPNPVPSETASASMPTLTPTIPASATPRPAASQIPSDTPTQDVFAASKTAYQSTQYSLVGPLAVLNGIDQYYNPVGTPLKTWHDIPIMSQATAGQEFRADVYSFKATASLSQASSFYASRAAALKWFCTGPITGYSGTGTNAEHSSDYMCQGFFISIVSMDNNTKEVIVIIEKQS